MAEFNYTDIDSKIRNYISGKSFQPNPYITMEDLAYLTISHYDFNDHETIGHLIANKRIAQDLCDIFCRLYNEHYQIEKMKLIDEYNADDELSMADNNSSAFNYRFIWGGDWTKKKDYQHFEKLTAL